MSWSLTIATLAIVFVIGVTCSPIDISAPATELLPPRDESVRPTTDLPLSESTLATDLLPPNVDVLPTLATDLVAPKIDSESTFDTTGLESTKIEDVPTPASDLLPPIPPTLATDLIPPPASDDGSEKKSPAALFLINVFAVKNHTAENSNDVLHSDVMKEVDSEKDSSEPLAMFLLVVGDEDESTPVSLDEVAKDLEDEGFSVERIRKDGDTRIVKVDLTSIMRGEEENRSNAIERVEREIVKREIKDSEEGELEESGKLLKVRRKRHLCLKCKLEEIKQKKYGGGGGCGGGCGGGGYYPQPPVYHPPPVYQPPPPVYNPPPVYHPQPPPRPPPQFCDPCQGGGGGGYGPGGGNSNSFSQASASASASSSSYGK